ncbi:MAG: cytochrome c [Nitrospirota bacterium]
MELRPVLAGSAGVLVVLLLAEGVGSQSFLPWWVPYQENGQRIYMSGVNAQGRVIQNSHGMEGVGCAMCHGPDGRGGTMHGIPVPNITVPFLTDPRGYRDAHGRTRPAYNEETMKAAIVAGIDSAGNSLHPEMPRWTGLTATDIEDLIGFLKTLGASRQELGRGSQGL